jgi:aminobenzoyl-glutamate transport protein
LLTSSVILAGLLAHVGGDVGFVLVIPLAGSAFQAAGRSPLAGLAAAFAGVSGGFSANVLIGTLDPLLAGLTESAARIIDPTYSVNALCNYYFMASSAFLIVAVGTWVTERITLPRFPAPSGAVEAEGKLSASERRGLKAAALALLAFGAILLAGTLPADGFLRDPNTGSLIQSPLISGIVTVIFAGGVIAGLAYGVAAGTIKNDEEVVGAMSRAMATMGPYLVMAFFASQFIAYFNATNLGLIAAIRGAALLKASGLGGMSVMLLLIALSAGINILIASSSAKWAIMAPVFVPMLMLLGHSPGVGAGHLSDRRQLRQRGHPADAVFPADRQLLPKVRARGRRGHGDRLDGPLFGGLRGGVDGVAPDLDGPGPAARPRGGPGLRRLGPSRSVLNRA